jgi:hypothetical protein
VSPEDAEILSRILAFLREIGLEVREEPLSEPTVLPGVTVARGGLVFDRARLAHPGDLLHEAGHLAVLPADERATRDGALDDGGGAEMAAIAWSFAAAVFLRLPGEVVFHPEGYKGGSTALLKAFKDVCGVGVPVLEWRGLTDFQRPGSQASPTRFPAMKRWLCA